MADMSLSGKFVRLILGILMGILFAALIIWIVDKLGIEGYGFGAAFIAVIFFAVLSFLRRLF